ncbi:MAG: hypothetical protein KIT56_09080 [Gammaproteobacteria bacterium]|nr:hypothetical protein [Gammaproteobacteria bacterium]MCW5584008.1 hypothetical protein [Gammaproteobacteria bacterium]
MAVLADLLLMNRKFSPTYHPKILANHLSMTLMIFLKTILKLKMVKYIYLKYLVMV